MKYLKIKHTEKVESLNYKKEDGSPVKIGDVVEVSSNMARTLEHLHWGAIVEDEQVPAQRIQEKAPEEKKE